MSYAAILLAAGKSNRMGNQIDDKIIAEVGGIPIFWYSANVFLKSNIFTQIIIVYRDNQQRLAIEKIINPIIDCSNSIEISWVEGGELRQDSVSNGLDQMSDAIKYVFIHDCARPIIRLDSLLQLKSLVIKYRAVSLASKVTDTIKKVTQTDSAENLYSLVDIDRNKLWSMETPQVFESELILNAYKKIKLLKIVITDDTAAISLLDHPVFLLEASYPNPKLTNPIDFKWVEYLLQNLEC